MSDRIKSALMLDFDNVFIPWCETNRDAAFYFARNPGKLVKYLETWSLNEGEDRDIIHKSVYMNTSGRVRGKDGGKDVYFSTFLPYFIQSGFSIVVCLPMTKGLKNAADIQIVMDVLQKLEGRIAYDELILAAGDSDFAPLLRYLRTNGRRTMIVSAGRTAYSFSSIAHSYLPSKELDDLIRSHMTPHPTQPSEVAKPDIVLDAMENGHLPMVNKENWARVLETFVEYADYGSSEYDPDPNLINTKHCVEWVRNRLMEHSVHLSPYMIRDTYTAIAGGGEARQGSVRKRDWTSKDGKDKMRNAIFLSTVYRFEKQSINLSPEAEIQLKQWLSYTDSSTVTES